MIIETLLAKLGLQVDRNSFRRGLGTFTAFAAQVSAMGVRVRAAINKAFSGGPEEPNPFRRLSEQFRQTSANLVSQARRTGGRIRKMLTVRNPFEGGGVAGRVAGAFLGVQGARFLFDQIIGGASAADETLSRLNVTFGDNAKEILRFADAASVASGRSRFELREFASRIGAVSKAMLGPADQTGELTTQISKDLTQLSVDLSSFFDTTELSALDALKSGLQGEVEPLKRFGIALSENTVAEFARRQGIRKSFKTMTQAEKVLVRHQAIMEMTADAQGDAARTAHQYANRVRRLRGDLKDIGVEMGLQVTPKLADLVGLVTKGTGLFARLAKNMRIVESVALALAPVLAALALKFAIVFAPALLAVGAFTALAFWIDSLLALFDDNRKSAIDVFFRAMLGDDKWGQVLNAWRTNTDLFGQIVDAFLTEDEERLQLFWGETVEGWNMFWGDVLTAAKRGMARLSDLLDPFSGIQGRTGFIDPDASGLEQAFQGFAESLPFIGDTVRKARETALSSPLVDSDAGRIVNFLQGMSGRDPVESLPSAPAVRDFAGDVAEAVDRVLRSAGDITTNIVFEGGPSVEDTERVRQAVESAVRNTLDDRDRRMSRSGVRR